MADTKFLNTDQEYPSFTGTFTKNRNMIKFPKRKYVPDIYSYELFKIHDNNILLVI